MSLRLKKMKELAIIEAKNLKKHATPEELGNLNYNSLSPHSASKCLYGQMTGNCYNDRACNLIEKCAIRVYRVGGSLEQSRLNGAPTKTHDSLRRHKYHSPIEILILPENGGNEAQKSIISFLKGETKKLDL